MILEWFVFHKRISKSTTPSLTLKLHVIKRATHRVAKMMSFEVRPSELDMLLCN